MSQEKKSELRRAIELIESLKLTLLDIDNAMTEEIRKDDEARKKIKGLLLGEMTREESRILEFLRKKGGPVPRRVLSIRYHNSLGSPTIDRAVRSLVDRGLVIETITSTKGRPLTTYSVVDLNKVH